MQQQGPLLSIITINYNNAQGLKQTMQSVLDLEFKDYEYIIIDGGSTDDSVDIIKYFIENTELKSKISFWCSEKDNGIYNAMNKGLSHVSGTLVNMMNSGDSFISDALNKLPIWERENKNAVLYGAVNQINNGNYIKTYSNNVQTSLESGLCSQAVFIPYIFHKLLGNYNEQYKICADFDFYQRINLQGYKFIFINHIICNFDISGISTKLDKLRKRELKSIKYEYTIIKKNNLIKQILKLIKTIIKYLLPVGIYSLYKRIKNKKP